jgi:hypothetical protein
MAGPTSKGGPVRFVSALGPAISCQTMSWHADPPLVHRGTLESEGPFSWPFFLAYAERPRFRVREIVGRRPKYQYLDNAETFFALDPPGPTFRSSFLNRGLQQSIGHIRTASKYSPLGETTHQKVGLALPRRRCEDKRRCPPLRFTHRSSAVIFSGMILHARFT